MVRTCQAWEHSHAQLWGALDPPTEGNLGGGGCAEGDRPWGLHWLKAWIESNYQAALGSGTSSVSRGTDQGFMGSGGSVMRNRHDYSLRAEATLPSGLALGLCPAPAVGCGQSVVMGSPAGV